MYRMYCVCLYDNGTTCSVTVTSVYGSSFVGCR